MRRQFLCDQPDYCARFGITLCSALPPHRSSSGTQLPIPTPPTPCCQAVFEEPHTDPLNPRARPYVQVLEIRRLACAAYFNGWAGYGCRWPEGGVIVRNFSHIVARPVRKKTNWVFAVGRLTACDALAASLCGLVVRVGECGEVSKACAVQRAASAVVSSSPFVQQASLGSSSGGWMTPAAGWNLSRPHNGRQWLNRSGLT